MVGEGWNQGWSRLKGWSRDGEGWNQGWSRLKQGWIKVGAVDLQRSGLTRQSTNIDLMPDVELGPGGQQHGCSRMRWKGGDLSAMGCLGQRLGVANHVLVDVVRHPRRVLQVMGHGFLFSKLRFNCLLGFSLFQTPNGYILWSIFI